MRRKRTVLLVVYGSSRFWFGFLDDWQGRLGRARHTPTPCVVQQNNAQCRGKYQDSVEAESGTTLPRPGSGDPADESASAVQSQGSAETVVDGCDGHPKRAGKLGITALLLDGGTVLRPCSRFFGLRQRRYSRKAQNLLPYEQVPPYMA